MSDGMRNCPFCDAARKRWLYVIEFGPDSDGFCGYCARCAAYGPICKSRDKALQAWNGDLESGDVCLQERPHPRDVGGLAEEIQQFVESCCGVLDESDTLHGISSFILPWDATALTSETKQRIVKSLEKRYLRCGAPLEAPLCEFQYSHDNRSIMQRWCFTHALGDKP